ncbi:MAG TPA: lytic transglycosylase domain-containing protein [Longimicrobium sp.]|nr:lytic transglycosylase domain-containing protein [Longimicrobium sp.]
MQYREFPAHLARYAGLAGMLAGLVVGSSPAAVRSLPKLADVTAAAELDPFRSVTHAGMLLAARTAHARLDDGRPWAAWNALRDFVDDDADELPPAVALLAARSAAGWDGWSHVRRLLEGRDWLAKEDDGAGLMLLGQAEAAGGDWASAAKAYRRYAAVAQGADRGVAHARLGAVLRRADRDAEAAAAFARAAEDLPEVADWMAALRADALAAAGSGDVASVTPGGSSAARAQAARAEARWRAGRGDASGAAARLEREASTLADDDPTSAAALQVERAKILFAAHRGGEAREGLRTAAADERVAAEVRARAAALLGDVPGSLSADDEMARAAAYEAAEKPGLAARSLRAAVAAGRDADGAISLRVARLLWDAADYEPAGAWARKAADKLGGEAQADAELLAARSLVRLGKEDDGIAALRRIAEQRGGTPAAGSAWFLLGDASGDRDAAIAAYRKAAAVPSSPFAREALDRLADRCMKAGDGDCAARAWDEYVARYPRGEQTAQVAYEAGVRHERDGRSDRARAMYAAAIAADPTAYHAVRAADRLGVDPLAAVLAQPASWPAGPEDAGDAAGVVRRLRALDDAGADEAWQAELDAETRRLADRPYALLLVAEGVRDAGHTVPAIRLGRRLLEERGGQWDERLLRVVFPLAFRGVLMDEADRSGIDPWLLAGLVRQESSFDPDAKSWVGARGLSQIMPSTGEWLAPGAGVRNFTPELLQVPEINLRMGARFLRDQLKRYRGARDLALAAYNAGPGRADRWKRELGYGRDVDAFREKIPFAETREYVKVVIRNAELYRRLYGGHRSPGLVSPER